MTIDQLKKEKDKLLKEVTAQREKEKLMSEIHELKMEKNENKPLNRIGRYLKKYI